MKISSINNHLIRSQTYVKIGMAVLFIGLSLKFFSQDFTFPIKFLNEKTEKGKTKTSLEETELNSKKLYKNSPNPDPDQLDTRSWRSSLFKHPIACLATLLLGIYIYYCLQVNRDLYLLFHNIKIPSLLV